MKVYMTVLNTSDISELEVIKLSKTKKSYTIANEEGEEITLKTSPLENIFETKIEAKKHIEDYFFDTIKLRYKEIAELNKKLQEVRKIKVI